MLNIVLFEPEIHYNAGNVGRTCVALEAKLWLVRPLGFRLDDRHLHRAGLDYWEHLDWEVVDDWAALIQRFPDFRPWFFTKTAEQTLYRGPIQSRRRVGLWQRNAGPAARDSGRQTRIAACEFPCTSTSAV